MDIRDKKYNWRELRAERDGLIAAAYAGDASAEEIAVHFGVSAATVRKVASAAGVHRKRGPKISIRGSRYPDRDKAIVAEYLAGLTLEQVGEQHKITHERVRQILNREGIEERLNGFYTPRRTDARIAQAEREEIRRAKKERKAAERAKARAMYDAGATYEEIASGLNRSIGWVQMAVWETGGPSRNPTAGRPRFRLSAEDRAEIARLWCENAPAQDIAAQFGIALGTCMSIAHATGAKRPITRLREQEAAR